MDGNTVFEYRTAAGSIRFAQDAPFWLADIDSVSSVEVDIVESQNIGQMGSSIAGQSIQPRKMTVDGSIFEPIAQNRRQLLNIMAPLAPATLTKYDGNEAWFLNVYPTKTPRIGSGAGVQHFQAQLLAPYPNWRTTRFLEEQVSGLKKLFRFPFFTGGRWWVSRFTNEFFKDFVNAGNVPQNFDMTIFARGQLSGPEVLNRTTGAFIRFELTMQPGETLHISTYARTVLYQRANGQTVNGYPWLDIASTMGMALAPGRNTLRANADEGRSNLGVRIKVYEGVSTGV